MQLILPIHMLIFSFSIIIYNSKNEWRALCHFSDKCPNKKVIYYMCLDTLTVGTAAERRKKTKKTFFFLRKIFFLQFHYSYIVQLLSGIYIIKDLRQNCQWQQHMTVTTILALATLGDWKQIEMILYVSHCPRGPRQVVSLFLLPMF
jgi:hypothetical protein